MTNESSIIHKVFENERFLSFHSRNRETAVLRRLSQYRLLFIVFTRLFIASFPALGTTKLRFVIKLKIQIW